MLHYVCGRVSGTPRKDSSKHRERLLSERDANLRCRYDTKGMEEENFLLEAAKVTDHGGHSVLYDECLERKAIKSAVPRDIKSIRVAVCCDLTS